MPVVIPEDIPAYTFLQQNAFVMGANRAQHQDIRALEVLIINLMPMKIETENQILSLLANSPLQVNITLLSTASYVGTNTAKSHLDRFYVNFSDIEGRNFDGAIVRFLKSPYPPRPLESLSIALSRKIVCSQVLMKLSKCLTLGIQALMR